MYYTSNVYTLSDYYRILDLPFNATQEDIKKAHRRIVKQVHPDVMNNDDYDGFEDFVLVDEAYKTLSHTEAREHYDFFYRKYILQEPYLKGGAGDQCNGASACKTCGPNPDNATSGTRLLTFILIVVMIFAFLLKGIL